MPEIILDPTTILWIQAIIGVIAGLMVKDIASNFVQGVLFKYQPHFQQGDHVIVDGARGVIVSVGYTQAVFRLQKDDGSTTWRYVSNSKISNLRLEKVVDDVRIERLTDRVELLEANIEAARES